MNRSRIPLIATMFQPLTQHLSEEENDSGKYVSCDTIRTKITLFLATKEMTQTAFLTAIGGVNSNSFGRFMKLKGPFTGNDNNTYWGARKFFATREKEKKIAAKEAKIQKKMAAKVKQKDASNKRSAASFVTDVSDDAPNRKTAKTSSVACVDPLATVVELPDNLPVFDDCDAVRTKIGQCIHKKELSRSGFAKAIGVTPAVVTKFLAKKGYNQGAGSNVYYNAFRYFENQRLQRGEPKSSHRIKSEKNYPQGYPLTNAPTHQWVFTGK